MKIDIKKIGSYFKWQHVSAAVPRFLAKRAGVVMFLCILALSGYCAYLWYSYVYNFHWSDFQKQQYMNNKDKGVSFNRTKFDSVVAEKENRGKSYGNKISDAPDIFRLKDGSSKQ